MLPFLLLKLAKIVYTLNKDINCSLYVAYFFICHRLRCMHNIERQLQISLNKIQNWSDENDFELSKPVNVHFCQQHKRHPDPSPYLINEQI